MNKPLFNRARVERPDYDEERVPLLYRTQPKKCARYPKFYSRPQLFSAMTLYRLCDEIPEHVRISELYDWAFHNQRSMISKRHMGYSVVHAVLYEPRSLKNDGSNYAIYRFNHILDLEYGLEWQINAPIYAFCRSMGAYTPDQDYAAFMLERMNFIRHAPEEEFQRQILKPLWESNETDLRMREPYWPDVRVNYSERPWPMDGRSQEELPQRPPAPADVRGYSRYTRKPRLDLLGASEKPMDAPARVAPRRAAPD